MQPDDAYWQRPAEPVSGSAPAEPASQDGHSDAAPPTYQGPPPTAPPPWQWRPVRVVQPAPPRRLPEQDHAGIDTAEDRARTFTTQLALAASIIMIIMICVVCGRSIP